MVSRLALFSAESRKMLTRQACFGFQRLGQGLRWRLRLDHPDLLIDREPAVVRFCPLFSVLSAS